MSQNASPQEIVTISHGGVNCYLLKTLQGCFLIDTGFAKKRPEVEADLQKAGCTPRNLKLIVLTHGDFDHTGNATYLSQKYSAKTAMHSADAGMVEHGDLFFSRKANPLMKGMGKLILALLNTSLKKDDQFTPDISLTDGFDLSVYGLDAQIVHTPGHSAGSVGVLTGAGDFFCGDLFENRKQPSKNSLMPDKAAFEASVKKLESLRIGMVYPGHGVPFLFEEFLQNTKQK